MSGVPATRPALIVLAGMTTAAGVEAFDCPVCGGPQDLEVPDVTGDPEDRALSDRACGRCGLALALGGTSAFVLVDVDHDVRGVG